MQNLKNLTNALHRWAWRLGLVLLILTAAPAMAVKDFAVHAVWFKKIDGAYALRASLSAGSEVLMQKLLQSGYAVRMHFQLRFIERRRWLPDREIGDISWEPEIFYDSLLDRYTFRVQKATEEFNQLSNVLARAGTLQAAPARSSLLDRLFGMQNIYILARYDLETAHLPPPLQVSLLTGEHDIHSGWTRFEVIVR